MDADLKGYLDWLRGHGLRFEVAGGLLHDEDHSGPIVEGEAEVRAVELPSIPPFVEHREPRAGISSDHATFSLACAVLRGGHLQPGTRFWDIGCGTGVLAVAAGLAGARGVVATDVDARALELAHRTAAEANIAVHFLQGSLLEPIPAELDAAAVVTANLPHKPCPPGGGLPVGQAGGEDGTTIHAAFAAQAEARLPEGAKVFFFLHSLPSPSLLLRYHEAFVLELLSWKRRFLAAGEYGDLQEHFLARSREGVSHVVEREGRRFLVAGVWMARRR